MIKPLKPVGHPLKVWSELKRPEDWSLENLPESAGVYEVVYCEDSGTPQTVPNGLPLTKVRGYGSIGIIDPHYVGVLYIGKAKNLKQRFGLLCRSWTDSPPNVKHGSRKKYDSSPIIQASISREAIRLRYYRLGTSYTGPVRSGLAHYLANILFPDHGQNRGHASAGAATSEEYSWMYKFVACYGHLPVLNSIKWEGGDEIDSAFLMEQFDQELM